MINCFWDFIDIFPLFDKFLPYFPLYLLIQSFLHNATQIILVGEKFGLLVEIFIIKYSRRSIIRTLWRNSEKFAISRVRYTEHFYKSLLNRGEQTLVRIVSRVRIIISSYYRPSAVIWKSSNTSQLFLKNLTFFT